jgi:hypothetical protein
MQRFLPIVIFFTVLVSAFIGLMGGSMVTDVAVWLQFIKAFFVDKFAVGFAVKSFYAVQVPFFERLQDRFLFLQINDPLLI